MNFLNVKTSWSNIELGLFKVCVGSIYLLAGTYFHDFLKDYLPIMGIVFFVTAIWVGGLWLKKMKENSTTTMKSKPKFS